MDQLTSQNIRQRTQDGKQSEYAFVAPRSWIAALEEGCRKASQWILRRHAGIYPSDADRRGLKKEAYHV